MAAVRRQGGSGGWPGGNRAPTSTLPVSCARPGAAEFASGPPKRSLEISCAHQSGPSWCHWPGVMSNTPTPLGALPLGEERLYPKARTLSKPFTNAWYSDASSPFSARSACRGATCSSLENSESRLALSPSFRKPESYGASQQPASAHEQSASSSSSRSNCSPPG